MLIEFKLRNFRSIKDEMTFSLLASSDRTHSQNLIVHDALKKDLLLKSAVIYGANASGKTNVLLGLNTLRGLVVHSHSNQIGQELPYEPFRLDDRAGSAYTSFRLAYIHKDIKYIYELSYNKEKVVDEVLYSYPQGRRSLLFSRTGTDNYRFTKDEKEQTLIKERTPPNVLYLSRAAQFNYQPAIDAFEWFKEKLKFIGPSDHINLMKFTSKMLEDPKSKEMILQGLRTADLGIDDVILNNVTIRAEELPGDLPSELKDRLVGSERTRILTYHKGVPFDLSDDESEGTKRMFHLIGPVIKALNDSQVLLIDELDTKLHHLMNIFLIELFQNTDNPSSQLVFTTHNTTLLESDLFRRDQIWFTERRPDDDSTDLYSLLEFHPRNDANIKIGYLLGRYGAIPLIKSERLCP